jgi:hypothetical protein
MPSAQVQSGTQPQGKGFAQPVNPPAQSNMPQEMQQYSRGKGSTTNAVTSGQPTYGQPNNYPNTVGQWDNASIQRTNQQPMGGGKGKG